MTPFEACALALILWVGLSCLFLWLTDHPRSSNTRDRDRGGKWR